MVRALLPWPIAWTIYEGKRLKILEATIKEVKQTLSSGQFILSEGELYVGTKVPGKVLHLITVQPEGKIAMSGAEFARGQQIPVSNE